MALTLKWEVSDRLTTASDTSIRKVARFGTQHFAHNPLSSTIGPFERPLSISYHSSIKHYIKLLQNFSKFIQKPFSSRREKTPLKFVVTCGLKYFYHKLSPLYLERQGLWTISTIAGQIFLKERVKFTCPWLFFLQF